MFCENLIVLRHLHIETVQMHVPTPGHLYMTEETKAGPGHSLVEHRSLSVEVRTSPPTVHHLHSIFQMDIHFNASTQGPQCSCWSPDGVRLCFFFHLWLIRRTTGVVSKTDVSGRAKEGEGDGWPPGFTHEVGFWWRQRGGRSCLSRMDNLIDSRNAKMDHDYQWSTWSPNVESNLMWSLASLPSSFSFIPLQAEKWLHLYTAQLCLSSWYRNLPHKLLRLPECRGIVLYLWVDTVWTFFLLAQRLSGWASCHNCVVN